MASIWLILTYFLLKKFGHGLGSELVFLELEDDGVSNAFLRIAADIVEERMINRLLKADSKIGIEL